MKLKYEFEPESTFSLYLICTKTVPEVNVVPEVDEDEDCQKETEERYRVADLEWDSGDDGGDSDFCNDGDDYGGHEHYHHQPDRNNL